MNVLPDCSLCAAFVANDIALDVVDDKGLQKVVDTFHSLEHPEVYFWTAPKRPLED